jgi:hypothetical protein
VAHKDLEVRVLVDLVVEVVALVQTLPLISTVVLEVLELQDKETMAALEETLIMADLEIRVAQVEAAVEQAQLVDLQQEVHFQETVEMV